MALISNTGLKMDLLNHTILNLGVCNIYIMMIIIWIRIQSLMYCWWASKKCFVSKRL